MRRRMNLGVTLAAFAVLASGVCTAGAAGKIEYGLKLKKGDKYFLKIINDQQHIQSSGQTSETTMGFGVDMDVTAVDAAGNMDVIQKYSWVKFGLKSSLGEIVYDSAKPGSQIPFPAQGFAALLGERMTLKLTPQGRVLEVGGLKQMRENVTKKLPEGQREQWLGALQTYLSEPGVKETTEATMATYPDVPVGVGDSWTTKAVLSQGFAAIIESQYTVKDRKDGTATLAVTSTIRPNPDAKPVWRGPVATTYKLSGKQVGTIALDESTGLASGKQQQEVTGQIKMVTTTAEQSQEMITPRPGVTITPITIKGTVTTEVTKR